MHFLWLTINLELLIIFSLDNGSVSCSAGVIRNNNFVFNFFLYNNSSTSNVYVNNYSQNQLFNNSHFIKTTNFQYHLYSENPIYKYASYIHHKCSRVHWISHIIITLNENNSNIAQDYVINNNYNNNTNEPEKLKTQVTQKAKNHL